MRILVIAVILLAHAFFVRGAQGTGTGTGSHTHMRKQHQHVKGENEKHQHHIPKRPTADPVENRDPKRPPKVLKNPKLLTDSKLVHDTSHIQEELPKYMDAEKVKNMSPRELDYHYFKIHDFDDNRKLDGLELMNALGHVHGHDNEEDDEEEKYKRLNEAERKTLRNFQRQQQEEDWKFYIELVDDVLEDNDKNKDGYLSYGEYINGRNRNYGQQEYVDNLE